LGCQTNNDDDTCHIVQYDQCYLILILSPPHPSHPRTWVLYPSVPPSYVFQDHPSLTQDPSRLGSSLVVFLLLDIGDQRMGLTFCHISIAMRTDSNKKRELTLLDRCNVYLYLLLYVCGLLMLFLLPLAMPVDQHLPILSTRKINPPQIPLPFAQIQQLPPPL
jgi:hypothetical protein